MSAISDQITIRLPRRFLEHPRAFHLARMRAAVWLYLVLLSRLPPGSDTVDVDPAELARAMGLPEGTIRSWLGHLRSQRYVEVRRVDGVIRVRLKRQVAAPAPPDRPPAPARFFTIAKLENTLSETGHQDLLEPALAAHADPAVKRALAGALAVPAGEIRRSRTALFLYLLKRHAQEEPRHDPRP